MKKLLIVAVCLAMTAALITGCGTKGGTDTSNSEGEIGTENSQGQQDSDEEIAKANEEAEKAYMAFLNGEMTVTTGEVFRKDDEEYNLDSMLYGTYDYSQLKNAIQEETSRPSRTKYAFVDLGQDGINELVVYFENVDSSFYNWTGIVRYNGESLELNGSFTHGYRTFAALYDTGYLETSGSMSASSYYYGLSKFDANGIEQTVFENYMYYGALATSLVYTFRPDGPYETGDYSDIIDKSAINVSAYEADGKFKLAVSDWSEDAAVRAREEELVAELVAMGAEQISYEEMEKLTDTSSYIGEEVKFTDFDDGK